ncbi:hypothetical protein [Mailhella massiliensis]|uniref:Uncharacterized protein n=1 Tax=Mailhella massiliensis TaxID=1903261 RepID=A0A921AYS2_9BACT|nr:hypothetical protein [Mailhella massiliensis]HJD98386.1 hypothetical protein [Mailhella massiliensis]
MPDTLQATSSRFISLNTDFGYDALGGVGRLGRHSMEVLTPDTRRTDRVPGPPNSVGRWFSKLLDKLTPSSWRAQGKFQRGLEDFSAQTGRLLGYLHEAGRSEAGSPERRKALASAFRELAELRHAATPMTSRGADYQELLQARVSLNMAILRDESPQLVQEMRKLKTDGLLDEAIAALDPDTQGQMIDDLTLIRDTLYADEDAVLKHVEARSEARGTAQVETPAAEAAPPQPYRSRFSLASLREFFLEGFRFKEDVQKALQEREATLAHFSGEARNTLMSALDTVHDALDDRLSADAKSFSQVQSLVDEKMNRAIRYAMNDVCEFALRHMDTQESTGQDGQDFRRIDADFVRRELDALEHSSHMEETARTGAAADDSRTNPALHAIRTARQQIRDISKLYGDLTEGLGELEQRDSRYRCCLLLHELAQTSLPESLDPQEFGEACDTLIAALHDQTVDSWAVKQSLTRLGSMVAHESMPSEIRARFTEARPELMRNLAPQVSPLSFRLAAAASSEAELNSLEKARGLHQAVGHAGALLQRARLPQADNLISQGLQVSRLAMRLRTADWRDGEHQEQTVAELRSAIGRFMANLTLAQMQVINAQVRSAQPVAKELDQKTAQEGLDLIRRSVELLLADLPDEQGGVVTRAALNDGLRLLEKGQAASQACDRLNANLVHKEKDVAEQLAVCLESGRDDAETALQGMLEGGRWDKGKHKEARDAVYAFLEALRPVRESRNQSQLLRFLANRLSQAFIPHDVYMGFDGSIHMLINTDRQSLTGSKKIQGTRWITLPPPDKLRPGVSTGVHRLDELLDAGNNRTDFYPQLHSVLTDYFSGRSYDFSLPEE